MEHEEQNNDFVSCDHRKYKVQIGHTIASSLSGFIAGFIIATIGWGAIFYMFRPFCGN